MLTGIRMTNDRVTIDKKRIINNDKVVDVNQLVPIKYKWAWEYYLDACANHWMPQEVSMQRDIEQWKDPKCFTDDERRIIKRNLGFFSTADTIVANNVVLAIYRHVDNPECRQYLLRQAFEEAIHIHSYQYIIESLSMDDGEIFNMYREVASIYDKAEFQMKLTEDVLRPDFDPSGPGRQKLLDNLIGYYAIMEAVFFYSGFVMLLSFGRQNRLVGACEQIQYILRDESMHMNFGLDMINVIIDENPDIWTPEFQQASIDKIKQGVVLEYTYAKDCMPNGILGLNSGMFKEYVQYIADRRFEKLRLPKQYGSDNPFPWMSEIIDLRKEKNFFETRVTEYQTGGTLEW
jgi:ribonucleoside-diphosphate reductase beta chain